MSETEENKKPVLEVRSGSVKASVWENKGNFGVYDRVKLEKVYKDDRNEWQSCQNYKDTDLQDIVLVVQKTLQERRVKVV